MNKEDKQYFTKLFKGLEDQVARNYVAIQKNSRLIRGNSDGIKSLDTRVRLNGLEMDRINHKIGLLSEGQSVWKSIKTDVEEIKENISDLPAIRQAISSHSLKLAKLAR